MRWILTAILGGCLCFGCASHKPKLGDAPVPKTETPQKQPKSKPKSAAPPRKAMPVTGPSLTVTNGTRIITLTQAVAGKVAVVNDSLRFVVLDFTLNRLPELNQKLGVFRGALKVGEVKVTGPEMNGNIAADLIAGEAQPGDLVRQE